MRRLVRLPGLVALLALAVAALGAPEQTLGPNIVANGGFEAADGATAGWLWGAADARKATLTVDDAVPHSGKRSVRLHSEIPFQPNVYAGLSQTVKGHGVSMSLHQHMNRFDEAQTAAMLAELGQGGGKGGRN